MKVHLFIDFWNFQLTLNDVAPPNYRLDWLKISPWLVKQAEQMIGQPLDYQGTRIYLSYDPKSTKDHHLRHFATNTLARLPGLWVTLLERKAKSNPICPHCHQFINVCPHCTTAINGMIEKGVDTAIVTDLLNLAWEKAWDIAILVSSDRDFIPGVELLTAKGYRVLNAHFPPQGMHLAQTCWGSIDIRSGLTDFKR